MSKKETYMSIKKAVKPIINDKDLYIQIKAALKGAIFGMSRGLVVIDENLEHIKKPLEDCHLVVLTSPKGMSDEDIKEHMIPRRIFVTNNSKHFLDKIVKLEYGIIATENIKYKGKDLAKIVSKAIVNYNLWSSRRKGFLLILKPNGRHTFKEAKELKG